MTKDELKIQLATIFPNHTIDETVDFVVMWLSADELPIIAKQIKEDETLQFDFLFCQTAVDKLTHFEVIYHLTSTEYRHCLTLKVKLENRAQASIESVVSLWQAAELYENEIFDLFGIHFTNHPNLRRLFLGDDWPGFPLRKDYKDAINIVSL